MVNLWTVTVVNASITLTGTKMHIALRRYVFRNAVIYEFTKKITWKFPQETAINGQSLNCHRCECKYNPNWNKNAYRAKRGTYSFWNAVRFSKPSSSDLFRTNRRHTTRAQIRGATSASRLLFQTDSCFQDLESGKIFSASIIHFHWIWNENFENQFHYEEFKIQSTASKTDIIHIIYHTYILDWTVKIQNRQ